MVQFTSLMVATAVVILGVKAYDDDAALEVIRSLELNDVPASASLKETSGAYSANYLSQFFDEAEYFFDKIIHPASVSFALDAEPSAIVKRAVYNMNEENSVAQEEEEEEEEEVSNLYSAQDYASASPEDRRESIRSAVRNARAKAIAKARANPNSIDIEVMDSVKSNPGVDAKAVDNAQNHNALGKTRSRISVNNALNAGDNVKVDPDNIVAHLDTKIGAKVLRAAQPADEEQASEDIGDVFGSFVKSIGQNIENKIGSMINDHKSEIDNFIASFDLDSLLSQLGKGIESASVSESLTASPSTISSAGPTSEAPKPKPTTD